MLSRLKICALAVFVFLAGCGDADMKASESSPAIYKINKIVTIEEVGCTIYEVEYKSNPDVSGRRYITLSRCAGGETSSRVNGNKGAYTDVHNIDVEQAKTQLDIAIAQQKQANEQMKIERETREKALAKLSPEERRLLGLAK